MSKGKHTRRPDYVVKIAVPTNAEGTKFWYAKVGAGWLNDNGWVNFDIITMPGVRFRLILADQERTDHPIEGGE